MLSGFSTILLNRTKFDQMFANQAVDKGAEIRTKSKVTNVSINRQGIEVTVRTPEGNAPYSVKGKVIVAADGPAGRIGRSHNMKLPTKYVHAVEYVVKGKHSETMDFYFDHELTPYGYSWVFPKEEYSKIGLVCRQVFEPAKRLNKLMERMEKKFNTKFEKINFIQNCFLILISFLNNPTFAFWLKTKFKVSSKNSKTVNNCSLSLSRRASINFNKYFLFSIEMAFLENLISCSQIPIANSLSC
ncbi:MAG: Digeranylgeranylglycerophospholipid reductase [Candidatus Heimdallarchaeota archaeon LC_3]|nr:MAG: Digeranylgeranylglycerophospholipid reductase [Candidatus Heimdallarchaeota archaeon LC_3]